MGKSSGALRIFAGFILSILFIDLSIVLPVYYSVVGIFQPQSMSSLIQNIDYVDMIKDSDDFNESAVNLGIDSAEKIDEIMKSDAVGEFLEDCISKLTSAMDGSEPILDNFNASEVKELIDKHMDDILDVIEEKTGETLDRDKAKAELDKMMDDSDGAIQYIVEEFESAKESVEEYSTVTEFIQKTLTWQFKLLAILVPMAILALIYLLCGRNYTGFMWIAVNTGVVGVVMLVLTVISGSGFVNRTVMRMTGFSTELAKALTDSAGKNFILALIVCVVITVLSSNVAKLVIKVRNKQ